MFIYEPEKSALKTANKRWDGVASLIVVRVREHEWVFDLMSCAPRKASGRKRKLGSLKKGCKHCCLG